MIYLVLLSYLYSIEIILFNNEFFSLQLSSGRRVRQDLQPHYRPMPL